MEDSILTSTKRVLSIEEDDPSFDLDIITHINSAFGNLHDLGVGPASGFVIDDADAKWNAFLPEPSEEDDNYLATLSQIKSAIFLRTRLIFDPPTSPPLLAAQQKMLDEVEWRLSTRRESTAWADPNPPTTTEEVTTP